MANLLERSNLDATQSGRGHPRSDANGLIEIARFNHIEAAKLFLRFGKRPVRDRHLGAADANRGGGARRLQRGRYDVVPALTQQLSIIEEFSDDRCLFGFRYCRDSLLVLIDQTDVSHRPLQVAVLSCEVVEWNCAEST